MKHKTLRTLLCVILTVCFCLSAIAPVSAAGLFSGDSGAASIFDEWIRSLKDRFIEKNPGTDETPATNETAAGNDFIRIFHLDCGRRYFTVDEIKGIIDTLEAKKYTHIELAFGNDGLRFLLDDMSVTANGKEYSNADVTAAIQAGNREYYSNGQNELSEADMNTIIEYANTQHISVIPLMNMPGHSNALISAMAELFGVEQSTLYTYENSNGGQAYKVIDNAEAVAFANALAKKYVDYFAAKGSEYFNIGADECGYTESVSDNYTFEQTIASDLLIPMAEYIIGNGMKPMMFNDGFNTNGALQNALTANTYGRQFTICYWDYNKRTTAADLNQAGFGIINTHNKWYYVAGKENNEWFGYDWAKNNLNGEYKNCSVCDSGFAKPNGCMLAYWCDKPTDAKAPKLDRVKELIGILSDNNTEKFTGNLSMPAKPAISGVPTSVQISDGTLNVSSSIAARWTSSNNSVITFEDAATKAAADSASYTETATARIVGAGTAIITATTANRGWSVQTVTVTNNGGTVDPGTEYDNRNVTVTAGGTTTDTITGTNYAGGNWSTEDSSIATISVTGKDASATDSYTSVSVKASELAGDNTSATATEYYTSVYNQYVQVYAYKQSDRLGSTSYIWGYMNTKNKFQRIDYSSNGDTLVSLYKKEDPTASTTVTFTGAVGAAGKTTYAIVGNVRYTITVTAEDLSSVTPLPIQLWITNNTIEGSGTNAKTTGSGWGGDSSLGGARYISVPATTANDTSSVYSEAGMLVVDAFAAAGMTEPLKRYEWGGTRFITAKDDKAAQDLVFWTGRIHNSANNNIQQVWGGDFSNSGSAFTYVRYYGKTWSVSADGVNWTDVKGNGSTGTYSSCKQQLAAYYMTRTKITDEVTTDVADWGEPKDSTKYTSQVNTDFVLLDFAVKYEDGTRSPNTFPVSNKTLAYHCESNNAACGTDSSGNRYRMLNNFRAVNTSDFEVYMVTVTMTNDAATGYDKDGNSVMLTAAQATASQAKDGYEYKGVEQIVWAIDEEARANSKLNDYSAISGSTTYSGCKIGGEPYVRGVEIYNKHGALITYYIRAIESDSNLIVHYLDRSAGDKEFYSYNIVVSGNTLFDESFAQVKENSKELTGNKVTNKYNVEQTVSADLSTMPAISAQYRYVDYTCVEVKRSDDGKEVFLYYTFDADVSFVVDFGLPLTIPYAALNENLSNPSVEITKIKAGTAKYGILSVNGTESITYTPNQTIDTNDSFNVTCTGTIPVKDETTGQTTYQQGEVTYTVYIIPATNVYYEETFTSTTANGNWSLFETANDVEQTCDENVSGTPGGDIYGFDTNIHDSHYNKDASGNNTTLKALTYSNGQAYKATLSLPEGKKNVMTSTTVDFTFKGTGFDLISECGNDTGILLVTIDSRSKTNGAANVSKGYLVDTYFCGDTNGTMSIGDYLWQVPVVRDLKLPYDTYDVKVYGIVTKSSGVVVGPVAETAALAMDISDGSTSDLIADILADCGISNLSVDDVEVIYMDENSVLNGGTGTASSDIIRDKVSIQSVAEINAVTYPVVANCYVDGFRVYGALGNTETVSVDAYTNDKENKVKYMSIWDAAAKSLMTGTYYVEYKGAVGTDTVAIADYKKNGPENEIYLAQGQSIAFAIDKWGNNYKLDVSAKVVKGSPKLNGNTDVNATEMYYSIAPTPNGTIFVVTLTNNTGGVLAVSGLKMSKDINIVEGTQATNAIVEVLSRMYSNNTYNPETFNVSAPETARKNRNFTINATVTAADVAKLTIKVDDGEEEVLNPYNTMVVENGYTDDYAYSKTYRFKKAGTYTFVVTAYDAAGNSVSLTRTVVVK